MLNKKNMLFSPLLRLFLIFVLCIMIFFIVKIREKNDYFIEEKYALTEEIDILKNNLKNEKELQDQLKIKSSEKNSNSDIEELAREHLGLIKKDEILIIPSN